MRVGACVLMDKKEIQHTISLSTAAEHAPPAREHLQGATETKSHTPEISLRAEPVFQVGNFIITNALLLSTLAMLLIAGTALFLKNKLALIPRGFQNILEFALEELLTLMDSVLGSRHA